MLSSSGGSLIAKAILLVLTCTNSAAAQSPVLVVDSIEIAADPSTLAPAAEVVNSTTSAAGVTFFESEIVQLTETVITNLTDLCLTNITLFDFGDAEEIIVSERGSGSSSSSSSSITPDCKVYPGDALWPNRSAWAAFNLLLGGRLIATVPIASSCYNSWSYDETDCDYVTTEFTDSYFHSADPTSVMWPIFQGQTCMPTEDPSASCTLGGYPSYAVNVSTVAHIQLAINFARNTGVRLVVKNTGHDFLGKSAGAGALSIWTHHLKDIKLIPNYQTSNWSGTAVKIGAGVQAYELYEAVRDAGIMVVGGEGKTVGFAGGYISGGGHSPLSSVYGMAADHVIAFEVVTPDGRFVTATDDCNSDLFWALRGGGGGTFGVVTSVLVKSYPTTQVTVMTFNFTTSESVTADAFWEGVWAYFDYFIPFTEAGVYAYFSTAKTGSDSFSFAMAPFFAVGMNQADTEALVKPWFDRLAAAGITIAPNTTYYSNFHDAWANSFPLEVVGVTTVRTGARLFPKANWEDASSLNATFAAIKSTITAGGSFLSFNIRAPLLSSNTANSVNPAWREVVLHAVQAVILTDSKNATLLNSQSEFLTTDLMQQWRDVTPGSGAYLSEGDSSEPDWQQAFYGSNYDRLYALKQKYDPKGLFYAHTAVGSEDWVVEGQQPYVPTQNGRLCRA